MKQFTLLSICVLLLSCTQWSIAQQRYVTTVAFYNLENLFDTENDPKKFDDDFTPTGSYKYTEAIYQKKLQNLAKVLSDIATDVTKVGPSIIGVSEIENDKVLKDLIQQPAIRDRKWRSIVIEGPDARGVDVGLLYNPAHFKVLEANSHFVDIRKDAAKSYTRDILQVTGLLFGDTVTVLVGHWPSRSGGEAASQWKRAKAAEVCKRITDSIVALNPNNRVIIMGDFNDDPVSPSVAKVLNAKLNIKDVQPGGIFNPFYALYDKGIGTLGYQDRWNLFDQIVITSGFLKSNESDNNWKFKSAHVFKKKYMINQFGQYAGYPHRAFVGSTWMDGYSDHFPTYIILEKKGK